MGNISRGKHKCNRYFSFGFTLVELMVVIGIIGIIAVLAVPNFARMQRRARIRGACVKTAQHFKQLRERAISTGGNYQIIFSVPDKYHYRMVRPDGSTEDFKLGGLAGRAVYFGGAGVAGQPPEATMPAPGNNGNDFPGGQLFIDGRGGATNGACYITNGQENWAVGITRLGKIACYEHMNGSWN